MKSLALNLAVVLGLLTLSQTTGAQSSVDGLARDVERAESIRAVKALQRTYAQYLAVPGCGMRWRRCLPTGPA